MKPKNINVQLISRKLAACLWGTTVAGLVVATASQAQTPAPASTPAAQAAPIVIAPTAPRYLAANCANCHGTDGKAQGAGFNLAGLKKDYLIEQMQAFKTGKRQATIMHQIAKGYSDAQIEQLADYFAAQK
jgi:cytochrome subunit of sulfide dehydrogenase